jgi:pimeloyl-ACP methyl ester carboxylesterase
MRAAPGVVRRICGRRACRSFTRDAAADLAKLAARLERRPMRGRVVGPSGRPRPALIDSFGLFTVLVAGDVNPALHSVAPGAISSALRGDSAPLLRSYRDAIAGESHFTSPRDFSIAAYAATQCQESPFPWSPEASAQQRLEQATAFVTAQAAGTFGPFGPKAPLGSDNFQLCSQWPDAGRASRPALGPLPDVPALLLAGGMDLRTPAENARAIAAAMPQAQLMVVRNSGHSVVGMQLGGCVDSSLRRFLAGGKAGECRGTRLGGGIVPPLPASFKRLVGHPRLRGRRGKTATAVGWTVIDGFIGLSNNAWAGRSRGASLRWGGLRGGSYSFLVPRVRIVLRRVSIVHGVRVTGIIRFRDDAPGIVGRLRITGRAASEGTLRLTPKARLHGTLGGRKVDVPLLGRRSLRGFAAAIASSSRQARLARRSPLLR